MDNILKAGWCSKEGGVVHNIKRRWTVLTFNDITYSGKIEGEIKGKIEITPETKVAADPTYKIQPCFTVTDTQIKRTYFIITDTENERDDWISMIHTAINIQMGGNQEVIVKSYADLYQNYINFSELIWNLTKCAIPTIVNSLKYLFSQKIFTPERILSIMKNICKVSMKKTKLFANLYQRISKECNITYDSSYFDDLPPVKSILIIREVIDGEMPKEYANCTEEEITRVFQKGSLFYNLLWDDADSLRPEFETSEEECKEKFNTSVIGLAARFGSYRVFMQILNSESCNLTEDVLSEAFAGGNIEIIKEIQKKIPKIPENALDLAVRYHQNVVINEYVSENVTDFSWLTALKVGNFKAFFDKIYRTKDHNKRDLSGLTSLMAAAEEGYTPICKLITELGGSVDSLSSTNDTALIYALNNKNFEAAANLLDAGANINIKIENGSCPLLICTQNNNADAVKFLVQYNLVVDSSNYDKETSLIIATKNNNLEIVKCLLEKEANPNLSDRDDKTALVHSVTNNNFEICQLLIEHGAEIYPQGTSFSSNAFFHALNNNRLDFVKFFVEHQADPMDVDLKNRNSIMVTMANGFTEISEFLLPFIRDYKQKDDKGIPLIFYATRKGQHNILKHIIENTKDFDIDIQIDSVSLLFEAVKCMNPDAVEIILKYKPLVDRPNEFGKTPLMEACTNDDDVSAQLLIDAGANINARDFKGNTPLHHSCISRGNRTGKLLLENGAGMELSNADGIPPLIAATMKKNTEMVRNLLLYSSNVNVMDAFGNSALIHAAQMNCPEIVDVLISFHADTSIINRNGNDALAAARKSGSPQIMKLLSDNRNRFTY